ncbi:MAG: YebC/PmpR family DNA-binding transcriptional regulator [Gammaproteobacteria bacterium]|nr:YebC/PmpR family DNA-binding transcriptional regulator [Gammaproteobacteria bacterium]MXX95365.1 YebC/PmpR family DNA-binding transcriptional regulator [Gammaproteobacteria bacterium]MYF52913.1 YebC/PmpR family DNA-binding transcriptional regulator [Gammaproteobacteria bacterium]MYK43403.1 YebC/PmpR family DNA-binding transcriptional regulator [Gammaproteobacteria bacterium]
MAGHSKWANIKHRKARQDAKRAKAWTKVIRELTVAARLGGGNASDNPRLRAAVDNAVAVNMPKDTMDRAIARGIGTGDEGALEEIVYEGYGPGGVAILVETMTDNRNRTVAGVRHAFSKFGGSLGTSGSVAYMFERRGILQFDSSVDEDQIMETALESGADDVETDESGSTYVLTSFESYSSVADYFQSQGLNPISSEVTMMPTTTTLCDGDTTEKTLSVIEALEDLDDVQNVFCNAEFTTSDDSAS